MWRCWFLLLATTACLLRQDSVLSLESTARAQEAPATSSTPQTAVDPADEQGAPEKEKPKEPVPVVLTNAQEAIRTFIIGMEMGDIDAAIDAMDFSAIDPAPDKEEKVAHAKRLKEVIDRLPLLSAEQIGTDEAGPPFAFPLNDEEKSQVEVARCEDGLWRFSAKTVAKLTAMHAVIVQQTAASAKPAEVTKEETPATEKPEESEAQIPPSPKTAVEVPETMQSARRVMRTLMDVLGQEDYQEYDQLLATLDSSKLDPEPGPYAKLGLARHLKAVIDRMELIDYSQISDDPQGPAFFFPIESENQPIKISRGEDGIWRFSADTVTQIENLYQIYKDRPVVNVPESEKPWYDRELLLGNETWRILALFIVIFGALLAGQIVRTFMRVWAAGLERRERAVISVGAQTIGKTAVPILLLIALNVALRFLVIEFAVEETVNTVIHVIFALLIGYILFRMVDVIVEFLRQVAVKSGSTLNDMLVPIVSTSLRLTVIVLVVLEIMTAVSNQPPSTVIAGLGAGGLAVGLAAQDTIKNFFGSVMIYADRPFELGDRIVIDGHDGPVEAVGFRSTRIRTLDGHLVTVPNGEMAYKTIHNVGKRPYIRRVMNIRVAYDTPPEKVRTALAVLREVLSNHEGMEENYPPRVFLHEFLETAINIRAIYWFHPPAYWDYCDFSERLNLEIIEKFDAAGIRFALPAQRLFLEGGPEKPIDLNGSPPGV
jgi:MscS family membrane protein